MADPGFNIGRFKAYIEQNGVLQNSKFMVRIPMPLGLNANSPDNVELKETVRYLEYWCEAAALPGMGLARHEVRRYGYGGIEERPAAPQYQNIQLQFLSDGKAAIYTFFHDWMQSIINTDLSRSINTAGVLGHAPYEICYKNEYAVDIEITVFNVIGKPAIITVLRDAFPIEMPTVPLAWADTNTLQTLPITFSFFDWYFPIDRNPSGGNITVEFPNSAVPNRAF